MINPLAQTQRIRNRKAIINTDINSQIKSYQKRLVLLSFSKKDVTEEYYEILEKIRYLRQGKLSGQLPFFIE